MAAGIGSASPNVFNGGDLFVPFQYVSGSSLMSTSTWDNATFANLGVTPGNTWGSGSDADSFTLDVVAPVTNTPLPAGLPLFASGLAALGLLGWRRKRMARRVC